MADVRLTASQADMLRKIANRERFGGKVKDLTSLKQRRLVHAISGNLWLTQKGRAVLAEESAQLSLLGTADA